MAITIKREKNQRGVRFGTLKAGDTFLYDNRVGVIMNGGGYPVAYDLTNCCLFRRFCTGGAPGAGEMDNDLVVLPIEIELIYKVVG